MDNFYRDTWVEIDVNALIHNFQKFKNLRPNQAMMAVIKANGYGHGDVQLAQIYSKLGVAYLAVSSLDEALHLRKNEINEPIIVLAPVKPANVDIAAINKITIVAYDEDWVKEVSEIKLCRPLKLHLEVETGMNRIGLRDVQIAYDRLSKVENIQIEGIYTHIASGDSNLESVNAQIKRFYNILSALKPENFKYVHIANTATTLQFNLPCVNLQRVGLGLYGLNPNIDFITTSINLLPTLSFKSRLTQVSLVKKGESVSYNDTFVLTEDSYIGTLSVGYADGWIRKNQGRFVLVNGLECEIIGRVCMDQMMIKINNSETRVGEVVTLIGPEMPLERVAFELDTIAYEILTSISDRVPRIYIKNSDNIEEIFLGRFK